MNADILVWILVPQNSFTCLVFFRLLWKSFPPIQYKWI